MIKVDGNKALICGTKQELLVEFMCMVKILIDKEVANRSELLNSFILATVSEEELKKALIDTIDEMDNIGDALNLLGAISCL